MQATKTRAKQTPAASEEQSKPIEEQAAPEEQQNDFTVNQEATQQAQPSSTLETEATTLQRSPEEMKKLAEAALFMSPQPINLSELARIMTSPTYAIARDLLDQLTSEFNARDNATQINKISDSLYQMQVRDELHDAVSHLAADKEFSKATLRTLGLIAVKQPVKQSIVVKIIGNKAYDYIHELGEKGFLKVKKAGNTKILETSPKFEQYFGKNVEKLKAQTTLEVEQQAN